MSAAAPYLNGAAQGYLSPTGVELLFVLLGLVTCAAALRVVTTRHLVRAALWLVVALGGVASCYLVLSAEFVAWVQVLIYVGAVVVLLLFGLMLTRAPIGVSADLDSGPLQRVAAALVAAGTGAVLVTVVLDAWRAAWLDLPAAPVGSARATGAAIFRAWVLPFEVLSVLLLAALIGAIVVSRGSASRSAGDDEGA